MNYFVLKHGVWLALISGSILFSIGYVLPTDLALQGATLVASIIGYVIYLRIRNWNAMENFFKTAVLFSVTLLMSLWASLCLLAACTVIPKLPLCLENKRNSFIILYFFFPMLIVFFSWVSTRWSQPKQ
jgi:hypothetical protein